MVFKQPSWVLRVCAALAIMSTCSFAHSQELNTTLMNGTYEIIGPAAQGGGAQKYGSVFFMGKPLKNEPTRGSFVLITAAHVLNEISGDAATIIFRKKEATGTFTKVPTQIAIRQGGLNLYKTHPDADVAVMYLAVPIGLEPTILATSMLADDEKLQTMDMHPGDELMCLGFPLSVDENSFPVVRSGLLASYPVTPMKIVKQLYFNFHTFPGNSGGPVYFSYPNRIVRGNLDLSKIYQGVIGLVSQQVSSALPGTMGTPLDIAIIVPSPYIQEAIALLPELP